MTLKTQRLLLITPEVSFAKSICDYYERNTEHLKPWEPKRPDNFLSIEYWEQRLKLLKDNFEKKISVRFYIFENDSSDIIGSFGFFNYERGPFQNCRLGYHLCGRHVGKGYMKEAVGKGVSYVFEDLNFHRVEANVIPSNTKSRNTLKSLGFIEHGTAPKYLKINGQWQDHIQTSLINNNYKEQE